MPIIPQYRAKFENKGEKELYQKAKESKYFDDPKRHLIHSVKERKPINKQVGEVDFIYFDDHFILFLESKGGPIKYDSFDDKWYVRGGREEGDPFAQVTDYLFHFRDQRLKELLPNQNFRSKLIFGYGVLFPHATPKENFKAKPKESKQFKGQTIEYDPEIVYYNDDHNKENGFEKYIVRLKNYWKNHREYKQKRYDGIGLAGIKKLRGAIRKDIVLEVPLSQFVLSENKRIEEFTEEQYGILDSIDYTVGEGNIISGGPGTGKTLLAKELCLRKLQEGKKVAYFCYNKNLASFIRQEISKINSEIHIYNIHAFLHEKLENSNLLPDGDRADKDYWRYEIPKQFNYCCESLEFDRYDYLVIDEGQDAFTEELIDSVFYTLKGGINSSNWTIFIDFNYQGFYEGFDQDYFDLFRKTYPTNLQYLYLNCRNSESLIKTASLHTKLKEMRCRNKDSTFQVKTREFDGLNELASSI